MNTTLLSHARMFVRHACIALAFFVLCGLPVCAQVKVLEVAPEQTDPAIETVHSPNLAVYDPQAASKHRLVFFIGGTGNKATNNLAFVNTFAKWGYHVVSLDYENNVLSAKLVHDTDPTAFDKYRNAIITGAPVSTWIKVDPANSILNRFQKLLVYLAEHDPQGGWDEFLKNGKPVWDHIIVAGHSQGSGHAAYLGKLFDVDRVLIFSGPQDYMADLNKPAPWLGRESATPPSRFFAFLSTNDGFNSRHQEANCMALMRLPKLETLAVKPDDTISGDYQIFINDVPVKRAHGSTISTQYTNVWEYMVTNHSD